MSRLDQAVTWFWIQIRPLYFSRVKKANGAGVTPTNTRSPGGVQTKRDIERSLKEQGVHFLEAKGGRVPHRRYNRLLNI